MNIFKRITKEVSIRKPLLSIAKFSYILNASLNSGDVDIKVDGNDGSIVLYLKEKDSKAVLPLCWLRDHCSCSYCKHPSHGQKMHQSGDFAHLSTPFINFDPHLSIDKNLGKVFVSWPSSSKDTPRHISSYDIEWLKTIAFPQEDIMKERLWHYGELKKMGKDIYKFNYSDLDNKECFQEARRSLWLDGLIIINNASTNTGNRTLLEIVKKFGQVRETFYGITWDVVSLPNASNIAYTNVDLDFHMDLCYFENPPGMQMLHCIENSAEGGESLFVDAYNAMEKLRSSSYPSRFFDALCKVKVPYEFKGKERHYFFESPIIRVDKDTCKISSLRYSPPFQGTIQAGRYDPSLIQDFYMALKTYQDILHEEDRYLSFKMKPGDVVIFQNTRILHARKSFYFPNGHSSRYIIGMYAEYDDFASLIRFKK